MPRIKTIIRPEVEIINITSLEVGSVYKRVVKKTYSDDVELLLGRVTDILSSDEGTVMTAIEFDSAYLTVDPKVRVFTGDSDLLLHPATEEEVSMLIGELYDKSLTAVEKAENDLITRKKVAEQLKAIMNDIKAIEA